MNFDALRAFQNAMWDYGVAGNDCAVYVEGKNVYRHMTGWADIAKKKPIDGRTMYAMYSMTKPITCASALTLYEKGKLLMDDLVSDYIPEYADMKVKRVRDNNQKEVVPAQNPMRILDLFTMSAGLSYDYDTSEITDYFQSGKPFTTLNIARALAGRPLEFEPGTHYLYSLCHDVLGAVIEVITGKSLGEYMRESLFEPLGMKDTTFHVSDCDMARVAIKYALRPGERACTELPFAQPPMLFGTYESGGGGLVMTVDDYARFANALCMGGVSPDTGARILSGGMVRAMRENQLDSVRLKDFQSNWDSRGYGYGLGVRTLLSRAQSVTAGEPGEFGWGGMAGTYLLIDPAYHLVLVYAQASLPGVNGGMHRRLRNLTYAALGM